MMKKLLQSILFSLFFILFFQSTALAIPPYFKKLIVTFNVQSHANDNPWELVPLMHDEAKSTKNIALEIKSMDGKTISYYQDFPIGETIRFTLINNNPSERDNHYSFDIAWDDAKGFKLNKKISTYCFMSAEPKLYKLTTSYQNSQTNTQAAALVNPTHTQGDLMIKLEESNLEEKSNSPENTSNPTNPIKSKISTVTKRLLTLPSFRVVLVNNEADIQQHHKFFALRYVDGWPASENPQISTLPKEAYISKRKALKDLRYSQQTYTLQRDDSNPGIATAQTQIAGDLTHRAQKLSSGNEMAFIIGCVEQQNGKYIAENWGYMKIQIKGNTVKLLEGNAIEYIDSFEAYQEIIDGKSYLTLALIMKKASELTSLSNSFGTIASTEDTDGAQATALNASSFSAENINYYIQSLYRFFSPHHAPAE